MGVRSLKFEGGEEGRAGARSESESEGESDGARQCADGQCVALAPKG